MKSLGSALESGLRKVFEDTFLEETGLNSCNFVTLSFREDNMSEVLTCSATFKYDYKEYGLGVRIDYKSINYDQYNVINTKIRSLAKSMAKSFGKLTDGTFIIPPEDPLELAVFKAIEELK